jgi:hypothetical protein
MAKVSIEEKQDRIMEREMAHAKRKARMEHVEKLQQQIDEQLVELANLRDQLSQEKILNQNQETYLNLLEKEVEDLIKTLKGKPRKKVGSK